MIAALKTRRCSGICRIRHWVRLNRMTGTSIA